MYCDVTTTASSLFSWVVLIIHGSTLRKKTDYKTWDINESISLSVAAAVVITINSGTAVVILKLQHTQLSIYAAYIGQEQTGG